MALLLPSARASLALLQQGLFELLITVEGVVIAELALYEILKASEKTKLTIKLRLKKKKLGFSVESENKTIKDAYPMCNNIRYQWEDDDDSLHNVKDLYVGAKPIHFYPFTWTVERKAIPEGRDIDFIVLDEVKGRQQDYIDKIPEKAKEASSNGTILRLPDVSIRIVGEGNETKRDYKLINTIFSPGLGDVLEEVYKSLDLVEKKRK